MLCAIASSSFIVIRASDWTLIVNSFVQLNSFCVNSCYVWNVFIMPGTDSAILLGCTQDADRWRALITVLVMRTNIEHQPTINELSEKKRKVEKVILSLLPYEILKNNYNFAEEVGWIEFSSAAVQSSNFNIEQTYHQRYFYSANYLHNIIIIICIQWPYLSLSGKLWCHESWEVLPCWWRWWCGRGVIIWISPTGSLTDHLPTPAPSTSTHRANSLARSRAISKQIVTFATIGLIIFHLQIPLTHCWL